MRTTVFPVFVRMDAIFIKVISKDLLISVSNENDDTETVNAFAFSNKEKDIEGVLSDPENDLILISEEEFEEQLHLFKKNIIINTGFSLVK